MKPGLPTLAVWAKTFEKYHKEILQTKLLMVTGKLHV
jgi:error-prone DNA polymerase